MPMPKGERIHCSHRRRGCRFFTASKERMHYHDTYHERRPNEAGNKKCRYSCDQTGCNYLTNDWGHLEQHLRVHSSVVRADSKTYECHICSFRSGREDKLSGHIVLKHGASSLKPGQKPPKLHYCDKCEYKTDHPRTLAYHRRGRHGLSIEDNWNGTKLETYTCDECDYVSNDKKNLRRHNILRHRSVTNEDFRCPICEVLLATRRNLRSHVISKHTRERPYGCQIGDCHFRAKFTNTLQQHYRTKHAHIEPPLRARDMETNVG